MARAGAQVKLALDTTIALNGENYVFLGRERRLQSLLNTDMKRELEHLGKFLTISRDYARSQGFKGTFLLNLNRWSLQNISMILTLLQPLVLKDFGLEKDFKINIEVNHATLAQHTFQHELSVAASSGMLGSIDANRGDYQNGWDTDQFPNNIYETTEAMLVFLQSGGLQGGGINFLMQK